MAPNRFRPQAFGNYIVYVDESGDHTLLANDPDYPIFVLAFCVFHKSHYSQSVVPALEKFKFRHFGHDQVVLHENEIRKEKGQFNIFRSAEDKASFLDELSEIVDDSNFILIACIIDKRTFAEGGKLNTNPYHVALASCMESLYQLLCEKRQQTCLTHVVVECRGKREDKELELEFRRVCDGQNQLGVHLPFEVVFSDKRTMSTGLQLADLVARPIGLSHLRPNQENRAFEILKSKFYCDGGRDNVGSDFEGVGLKVFPSP
ncbi:MAG: DUF3800 domain-containing protein [Burkholderiaceae bacterium]